MLSEQNTRAILVYLPYDASQFELFKVLLQSLDIGSVHNTDLLVLYDPRYENIIANLDGVWLSSQNARLKALADVAQLAAENIFHAFSHYDALLANYQYIFLTDVNSIISPRWNNFIPQSFSCGTRPYTDWTDALIHPITIMNHLELPQRKDYCYAASLTWLGDSNTVRKCIAKAGEIYDVVKKESLLPGTSAMQQLVCAGEVAINHLVRNLNVDGRMLDVPSDAIFPVNDCIHIRGVSDGEIYSTNTFLRGGYSKIDSKWLDITLTNQFCLYCALSSKQ